MNHTFAAIDIGSNAIRLLFSNVYNGRKDPVFKKAELVRVPVRLGDDAFLHARISPEKIQKLVDTMRAFRNLMSVYGVKQYKAYATSAMREAKNSAEIIRLIKDETGIVIEVIDGKTEAETIFLNHIAEFLDKKFSYLYIDVGGGSTELTLFSKGKAVFSRSFNIGTIRLLYNRVDKDYWKEFKDCVENTCKSQAPLIGIGSGGNINKLYKMSDKKDGYLSFNKLKSLREELENLSFDDRVTKMGLRPDRADVIVPAAKIYLTVMKKAGISKLLVPQIGLSDGIIHKLYDEQINSKKSK